MAKRSTFTVGYITDGQCGYATEIVLVIPHITSFEYDADWELFTVNFVGNDRFRTAKLNHPSRDIEGDLQRAIEEYYA